MKIREDYIKMALYFSTHNKYKSKFSTSFSKLFTFRKTQYQLTARHRLINAQ